jgi:hypothetical protein
MEVLTPVMHTLSLEYLMMTGMEKVLAIFSCHMFTKVGATHDTVRHSASMYRYVSSPPPAVCFGLYMGLGATDFRPLAHHENVMPICITAL